MGRRRGRRRVATGFGDGRVRLLSGLVILALVVVAGRATLLAATSHDLTAIAADQQTSTVEVIPHRGAILDRSGEELAVSREQYSVYATPSLIEDPDRAAGRLAEALGLKKKKVLEALSGPGLAVRLHRSQGRPAGSTQGGPPRYPRCRHPARAGALLPDEEAGGPGDRVRGHRQ